MSLLLQLLRFEFLYQSKQRALPLFSLLFFLFGFFLGGIGQAPAQVDFNAAYQVVNSTTISCLGCVFIIMFFAVSGALRDKKYQMQSIVFSTPIQKKYFFWSRFIGVFIYSTLAFSLFLPGFIAGLSISDLDPARIAVFDFSTYIWPMLVIVVPNFFICTALIFSVSILTKNNLATYSAAVLIYILYFLVAFYSNSPIIASSVPATPEQMAIAALTDPFAGATFFEYTQFWTPYEKSSLKFTLSGSYLWNRLIWTAFSLVVLVITYHLFSFRQSSQRVKKIEQEENTVAVSPYFAAKSSVNSKTQWIAFWSSIKIDIIGVYKSLPFLVVILTLFSTSILELYARIFDGGAYGDSWYPFTNLLIEIVMELVPMMSLILIVLYSGELIWRARDKQFDSILNTSPTLNWAFFLSKLIVLALIPMILITTVIIVCMGFQLINGYTNIEIDQYLAIFYYNGATLFVSAIVAVFIQSVVNHKYLGMGITALVLLFLGTSLSANLGIEHPMLRIGNMPTPIYSNMAGYSLHAKAFNSYALYWLSFGTILSILSFKLWNREINIKNNFKNYFSLKKWKQWELVSLSLGVILFTFSALNLFNELNIKNTYQTSTDRKDYFEQYERLFKQYDTIPRLHYTDMKTKVDIFPTEQKYEFSADYQLLNKNNLPVTHLFITERKILSSIHLENAKLVFKDTVFGTYLFKFNNPILPQETARFQYQFTKQSSPYKVDRTIVKNGTYIRHDVFEPVLGYRSSLELSDPFEREQTGLPKKEEVIAEDDHLHINNAQYGKVKFRTVVSTDSDQIALAPGNLVKKQDKNNRSFYTYEFPAKHIPALAYFSADYALKTDAYEDISLEYYYQVGHDTNHKTINESTRATLDYCLSNFGGYLFDHLRIAEIPSYHPFGGAAHPGLINMVEDNLYLIDIRNTKTFDLVSKRTIHEVAHQWWGMQLTPKNVSGASFITEGFTKYTEGVVLENMYGKGALWELNKQSISRYFSGRTFASVIEPPLYLQQDENYLIYGKNGPVLLSIRDLIGEETLNNILQSLMQKYRHNDEPGVHTLEFLEELYKLTSEKYHPLVNDWMKRIIRYDLSIISSTHEKLEDGTFDITIKVQAKRYKTLKNGQEREIDINEPIQIGLFNKHPKNLAKKDIPIYLNQHLIKENISTVKINVESLPNFISVDPFLTRIDRIYSDNTIVLK
ncbi:M1 family aminopeptidase [Spongiivirga sp. MCCC 1A20706]|uniref:ABC transporter permease/M1 family aminopeptidase n=1 Tax=Spongiivirga sp. MCCC 1A20706 TaxID=3160963 RepID=UPI0039776D27